ncbi:hypothetical protein LPJ61_001107 [Coemansia biformis]|uniref:Periplasmic binding protein n=1 Tax=Coemansia biformis TaxID=1286918 RepID=A0A9W7YHJ4_9FUNG|nr:hypothetical protein LPJ61_001107 [Coemansia biformis]
MRIFAVCGLFAVAALAHDAPQGDGACGFDKVDLTTGPGFTITVNEDYKVLEDTAARIKYGLYCNSQPSGISGIDKWFKVPVASVGVRVPIASGFLEALGRRDKLTAAEVPGNLTNICLDASKLRTLSAGGSSGNDTGVDVVFSGNAASDGNVSVRLPSDDALTPLQRAEWIKFVAAFFNDEKRAAALFDSIASAYNCHWNNLQHLKDPPHTYWVEYSAGADGKASYNIIDSAYQKDLLAGAGATNNTRAALSDPSDLKKFQEAIRDADFVIDQTALGQQGRRINEWYRDFGYADPQNSGVGFLRTRNIWRTDGYTSKSGVDNFPEFGYVRPDLVLLDIIGVLEPTYASNNTRRWMLWLGGTNEDTTVIAADNYDCSSPWISSVAKCTARTDFTGGDSGAGGSSAGNKDDHGSTSSGRAGKIAGGIIGALAAVALIVVGAHYYNRHRRLARVRALSQTGYGAEGIGLRNAQRFS